VGARGDRSHSARRLRGRSRLSPARTPRATIAAALVVVALDQASKALVRRALPLGAEWPPGGVLGGWFAIHHVANTGMAFGLARGSGPLLLVVALAVAGGLLTWAARVPAAERTLQLGLGLVVGGALGNVIDRLHLGHVVDFLDARIWPVFNLADSAISIGVVILAWHAWREERRGAEPRPDQAAIEPAPDA